MMTAPRSSLTLEQHQELQQKKSKKTLIPTGEKSKIMFSMPMGDTAASTDKMNMDHNMRYIAT